MNTENEYGNQDEIKNFKNIIETNLKDLDKKDKELTAAQECIEIIHDKLKSILIKKMADIINNQFFYQKAIGMEMIKFY